MASAVTFLRGAQAPMGQHSLAQRVSAGYRPEEARRVPEGRYFAHTYCTNLVHCVFSTKMRSDAIGDEIRERLFAYLFGIAKNLHIEIFGLGGTANHLHILMALPAKCSLLDTVRDIKANSSRGMSENGSEFSCQEGFGAFSVSPSQAETVKRYIRNAAPEEVRG